MQSILLIAGSSSAIKILRIISPRILIISCKGNVRCKRVVKRLRWNQRNLDLAPCHLQVYNTYKGFVFTVWATEGKFQQHSIFIYLYIRFLVAGRAWNPMRCPVFVVHNVDLRFRIYEIGYIVLHISSNVRFFFNEDNIILLYT